MVVGNFTISGDQEEALLAVLGAVYPGPYVCEKCREAITPSSGWKPRVLAFRNDLGVMAFVMELICGPCMAINPDLWEKP